MTSVTAQFNGRVLSSFQWGQAFSDLFLSAMYELWAKPNTYLNLKL